MDDDVDDDVATPCYEYRVVATTRIALSSGYLLHCAQSIYLTMYVCGESDGTEDLATEVCCDRACILLHILPRTCTGTG